MRNEKRRPRESFTRALRRIAGRIDEQRQFTVTWDDWVFRKHRTSVIKIKSLWAVGSWARGALDCGDLDLVMDFSTAEGREPSERSIDGVILRRAADVRMYSGTPEKNSSGAAFPEAVLIWSESSPQWENNIEKIRPDPTAARFPRKTDAIPLRAEQLRPGDVSLDEIVDMENDKIVSWSWVDAAEIRPCPERWSEEAKLFYERVLMYSGKKTKEIIPLIIEWLESSRPRLRWRRDVPSRSAFDADGVNIVFGEPFVQSRVLDQLSCSALVLAPHLTRRGPNGLWVIQRGPNHWLAKLLEAVTVYYLINEEDHLPLVKERAPLPWSVFSLDLFSAQGLAEDYAEKAAAPRGETAAVTSATGSELLELISRVDIITVDRTPFALTRWAELYDEGKLKNISPDHLRELLKRS